MMLEVREVLPPGESVCQPPVELGVGIIGYHSPPQAPSLSVAAVHNDGHGDLWLRESEK